MRTLREKDARTLELQEMCRDKTMDFYIQRRAGRIGDYSIMELFLGVDRYVEEEIQRGTVREQIQG